jgi:hypothetical protein
MGTRGRYWERSRSKVPSLPGATWARNTPASSTRSSLRASFTALTPSATCAMSSCGSVSTPPATSSPSAPRARQSQPRTSTLRRALHRPAGTDDGGVGRYGTEAFTSSIAVSPQGRGECSSSAPVPRKLGDKRSGERVAIRLQFCFLAVSCRDPRTLHKRVWLTLPVEKLLMRVWKTGEQVRAQAPKRRRLARPLTELGPTSSGRSVVKTTRCPHCCAFAGHLALGM